MNKLSELVSTEEFNKITLYIDFLLHWNKSFSLVSRRFTKSDIEVQVLETLILTKEIHPNEKVLDLGTGSGIVGIILGILKYKFLTLVDISYKKTVFLKEIARVLQLDLTIHNDDIAK